MMVITGASGKLGSYSLKFLKRVYPKEFIVGTYFKKNSKNKNVELTPYALNKSNEFVANLDSSKAIYFIHFASSTSFDFNINYRNDICGIRALINCLPKKYNYVKFIYISSTSVKQLDSDYSVTKKYIENLLIKASSNSFSVRILRVPFVYKNNIARLVKIAIKKSTASISENYKIIQIE